MSKKKKLSGLSDIVKSIEEHVRSENVKKSEHKLPSIIEFVENKE